MKVLLVDDEQVILNLLQRIVEAMGYEYLLACNGAEALEVLRTEKVDVIVTDLMMPVMDGWTLATRVREAYPDVRVVGISGKVTPGTGNPRFDAFVSKPFNLEEIGKAIAEENDQ